MVEVITPEILLVFISLSLEGKPYIRWVKEIKFV